ncbi:hypothetical protein N7447_011005 [Penicillium robsamsonii]|uniref:uncharacterized protein n=1 Tax=Penicillium robsamsonii TaxID=1792511 RepID=UPI0025474585|nr:uncharacterized protein N7447_011005 [Penicillium robsamsonii]KAJ5807549.1 hypothetical protein N7447_011005 [Penicillium robsamsonii]
MRFPLPLSHFISSNSSFSSFPPSYLSPPFFLLFEDFNFLFSREFCFSSLVADSFFFASRISTFHARLFAWLRYDLILRRSFFNDSTKF